MINNTIKKFLATNKIDIEKIRKLKETKIKSTQELNPIVYKYGIFKNKQSENISIFQILGYDYKRHSSGENDIFEILSYFYDEKGSQYHQRSIGLLKYDKDEIIDKLSLSFIKHPIYIEEINTNQYIISVNGLHRFSIIKIHFIIELSKCSTKEEIDKLKEKYKIPVKVIPLDKIKTYCYYLLNITDNNITLSSEYQKDLKRTEKVILKYKKEVKIVLNDYELIEYTKNIIKYNKNIQKEINNSCKNIEDFKIFIETYFEEYLEKDIRKGVIK